MRILHVGSEIRHELGCAASLIMQGYEVLYVHLGTTYEPLLEKTVFIDSGVVRVPMIQTTHTSSLVHAILSSKKLIPTIIEKECFDIAIVTPSIPFYIAYYIARKSNIPLILRVWGIRANKLVDHIIYGKNYLELLNFYPSILHSLMQIWSSQALVVLDDSTAKFLRRLPLFKKLNVIYPTYAALYNNDGYISPRVRELAENEDYVFSFVTMSKTGSVFRLEQMLFRILYLIAKKYPEINVIIAGGTVEEARKKFGLKLLPKNLLFAGRGLSDDELRVLYRHARLVVIPIFFRSVSNRLLEALFYGKPILTNSIAKLLHNKLKHLYHIFILNNYLEYPNIVRKLLKDDILLEDLAWGAKEAYSSFFSARKCGLAMKHIIESIESVVR
ncbi:MAG: glycosyltransferase [Sulfolobales archaeon]